MNPWLDRFTSGLGDASAPQVTRDEAALVLDLAGAAARSAGARQFAPLAAYLAGRAAATADEAERCRLLRAASVAAEAAGAAEQPLGID